MSAVVDAKLPDVLRGERVALTGRLASLTGAEAAVLIRSHGGRYDREVTWRTSLLVVGQEGWPLRKDGTLTRKLQRARLLAEARTRIQIVSEEAFLERLGLQERGSPIYRRYTLLQLSRILNLSPARLRNWLRAGLIAPVETVHRLAYFDFAAVTRIRTLAELISAGVSPKRLQRSLRELRTWLPDADDAARQLRLVAGERWLRLRLPNGRLAESSGQLLLDFDEAAPQTTPPWEAALSADRLFELAVDQEEAGHHEPAAATYRRWIARFGPDPDVCFNLGNTLHALGDWNAAATAYREAVRLDPLFVAAWNNLGRTLFEQGECDEAVRVTARALQIDPSYADAHYNLADLLDQMGRIDEARPHWQAYLRFDARSPWADHARSRLAEGVGRN